MRTKYRIINSEFKQPRQHERANRYCTNCKHGRKIDYLHTRCVNMKRLQRLHESEAIELNDFHCTKWEQAE